MLDFDSTWYLCLCRRCDCLQPLVQDDPFPANLMRFLVHHCSVVSTEHSALRSQTLSVHSLGICSLNLYPHGNGPEPISPCLLHLLAAALLQGEPLVAGTRTATGTWSSATLACACATCPSHRPMLPPWPARCTVGLPQKKPHCPCPVAPLFCHASERNPPRSSRSFFCLSAHIRKSHCCCWLPHLTGFPDE